MTAPLRRQTFYIDTSAAVKVLEREAGSEALRRFLDEAAREQTVLVSSVLLVTELRRVAVRHGLDQAAPGRVLDGIALADTDRSLFLQAGLLPDPALRSLDALHLACALQLDVDALIAYDVRLHAAARSVGLATLSPS